MHGVSARLRGGIIDLFISDFVARRLLWDFYPDTSLAEALQMTPWSDICAAMSLVLLLAAAVMAFIPVAANLKEADLHGVRYDGTTRWPRGFDPATHGAVLVNDDAEPPPAGH